MMLLKVAEKHEKHSRDSLFFEIDSYILKGYVRILFEWIVNISFLSN